MTRHSVLLAFPMKLNGFSKAKKIKAQNKEKKPLIPEILQDST